MPLSERLVCPNGGLHSKSGEPLPDAPPLQPLLPPPCAPAAGAVAEGGGARAKAKPAPKPKPAAAPERMQGLVARLCHGSQGTLVFCSTKAGCEETARALRAAQVTSELGEAERVDLEASLAAACPDGERTEGLRELLGCRVGFHHAGLTDAERGVVEAAFSCGQLRVLAATSSLGAGVNLPVARVVFKGLAIGKQRMSPTQYRQMAGRAPCTRVRCALRCRRWS